MAGKFRNLWVSAGDSGGIQSLVEKDICWVFDQWASHDAPYYEESAELFSELVRPQACYKLRPSSADLVEMNLAYTEWFLFEFPLLRGMTPLELSAGETGAWEEESSNDRAIRLSQVADTQRFSQFCISGAGERGAVRLVDVIRDEEIELNKPELAQNANWCRGIFGLRVAKVDGTWVLVGKNCFCDRAPYQDRSRAFLPTPLRSASSTGSLYLDLLRETIGLDGLYASDAKIVA